MVTASTDRFLVHFDVDVIDFFDLPVADVLQHNTGLTFAAAMAALTVLVGHPAFAGLIITEFNPDHGEPNGSTARPRHQSRRSPWPAIRRGDQSTMTLVVPVREVVIRAPPRRSRSPRRALLARRVLQPAPWSPVVAPGPASRGPMAPYAALRSASSVMNTVH